MKIFIGNVVWREETVAFSQSLRSLVRYLDEHHIEFTDGTVVGDALVSRARSIVASAFLRSDCDVLLTIDSDIWFRAQDAVKLCTKAMDYGIIAGLYPTRSLTAQPAMMLPDDEAVIFDDAAEPAEVPYVSTGFEAVRRDVFETLATDLPHCHRGWEDRGADTSFWPFYMPFTIPWEGDGHMYLSEDWAFCERAKQAGFKCYLDPSIRLGHMATVMLTLEDLVRADKPSPTPLRMLRSADGALQIDQLQPIEVARGT